MDVIAFGPSGTAPALTCATVAVLGSLIATVAPERQQDQFFTGWADHRHPPAHPDGNNRALLVNATDWKHRAVLARRTELFRPESHEEARC